MAEKKVLKACPACHGWGVVHKPGTLRDLMKCEPCGGEGIR